jgi:thiazole synthase
MKITVNGKEHEVAEGTSVEALLAHLGVKREYTAVAVNREVTPRSAYAATRLNAGDKVEIVRPMGGGSAMNDTNLVLGGKEFSSRLIVGTGKYSSIDVMKEAHEASGAQIITVALRRVSLPSGESLLDHLDTTRYTLLPNTAGCYSADEAIRTAYLAREAGLGEMLKLEVIGDTRTLFPDVEGLLEATRKLARDGFTVMPYTNDDPVIARKLEDAGAACVMPLAAPIGSGLGIRNPYNIKIILESVSVPVIVDAGVGTASDAAIAMELGCEGVLMNTAIAGARDPVAMARAMRLAIEAGRLAYRAGRIGKKLYATASSPLEGVPDWTS